MLLEARLHEKTQKSKTIRSGILSPFSFDTKIKGSSI